MFIHFDTNKGAECDNCGTRGTIMHMSVLRVDQTVSLCIVCFGAVAQAFSAEDPESLRVRKAQNSSISTYEALTSPVKQRPAYVPFQRAMLD